MKKNLVVVLLVCGALWIAARPVAGQTSASPAATSSSVTTLPADAPTHDQVMTLLDLMQARKMMLSAVEGMKKVIATGAEDGLRRKVPNPTPKQIEQMHALIDAAMEDLPVDEVMNAVVAVYQRHLSKTDVEEMIRFYSSPVGQKLLREQPQMMQESMQAGAEIQRKRYDEIMLKIQKKADELLNEDKGETPKK